MHENDKRTQSNRGKRKRAWAFLLAFALFAEMFAGVSVRTEAAKSISMRAGERKKVSFKRKWSGSKVTWSTNNKKAVTFGGTDAAGWYVYACRPGKAKITVKEVKGSKSRKCSYNIVVKKMVFTGEEGKDAAEAAALKDILKKATENGIWTTSVEPDLNAGAYKWSSDGKLIKLNLSDTDIEGTIPLESFPELQELKCNSHRLTKLDVNKNKKLVSLSCTFSLEMKSLTVKNMPELELLSCYGIPGSKLKKLDVSNNPKLRDVQCQSNAKLSSLNLSNTPELSSLNCSGCNLSSLDVSESPKLEFVICTKNKIKVLDFSNNPLMNPSYSCTHDKDVKIIWPE